MDADKRLSALLSDYHMEHGHYPRRIAVSAEVARELEAILDARNARLMVKDFCPLRLREGRELTFQGVQVIADMDPKFILDMR